MVTTNELYELVRNAWSQVPTPAREDLGMMEWMWESLPPLHSVARHLAEKHEALSLNEEQVHVLLELAKYLQQ